MTYLTTLLMWKVSFPNISEKNLIKCTNNRRDRRWPCLLSFVVTCIDLMMVMPKAPFVFHLESIIPRKMLRKLI